MMCGRHLGDDRFLQYLADAVLDGAADQHVFGTSLEFYPLVGRVGTGGMKLFRTNLPADIWVDDRDVCIGPDL